MKILTGDLVLIDAPKGEGLGLEIKFWPSPFLVRTDGEEPIGSDFAGSLATVITCRGETGAVYLLCEGRLGWYLSPRSWLKVVSR